jgi:hypothetical protein
MSVLNMDAINKAMKLIEESHPQDSIEMILLTDRLSTKEVYQVKYKDKKYLLIPYQAWNLILKEIEPRSFCNHDFVSYWCESYAGIPICENDELVMEILEYVFKNLNMIYNKDEEWKLNMMAALWERSDFFKNENYFLISL